MDAEPVTLAALAADPHPVLARLRAAAPVLWVDALGGFVVVGREAAVAAMRDAATFTVDDPRFTTARVVGPSMLSLDGAEHARHRTPFVAPFRPRRVDERLGATVARVVSRRMAAVAAGDGRAEIRAALAGPVAAAVMAHALGLDGDDDVLVARLLGWYREIVAAVAGLTAGGDVPALAPDALAALDATLRPVLRQGAGSLLGEAAAGALRHDEVIANAAIVLFGGIETTEAMILNALWYVLGARWRPSRPGPLGVASAVEESLRLEPAAAQVDRYATRDAVLGGVAIPAGAYVVVSLAAANRDPAEFADPDRFDPDRPNLRRQLAFATGPHVCLGMDLARLEAYATVAALLEAYPGLTLDPGSPPPTGLVFRKPDRLDATW